MVNHRGAQNERRQGRYNNGTVFKYSRQIPESQRGDCGLEITLVRLSQAESKVYNTRRNPSEIAAKTGNGKSLLFF